jgi:hypothetical protein
MYMGQSDDANFTSACSYAGVFSASLFKGAFMTFFLPRYAFHSDYSWELKVQSSRRLPSDTDTPQGQFATNSKLGLVINLYLAVAIRLHQF